MNLSMSTTPPLKLCLENAVGRPYRALRNLPFGRHQRSMRVNQRSRYNQQKETISMATVLFSSCHWLHPNKTEGPGFKAGGKKMSVVIPHPPLLPQLRLWIEGWNLHQILGESYKLAWVFNNQKPQNLIILPKMLWRDGERKWQCVHVYNQWLKKYNEYVNKYSFMFICHEYIPWILTVINLLHIHFIT